MVQSEMLSFSFIQRQLMNCLPEIPSHFLDLSVSIIHIMLRRHIISNVIIPIRILQFRPKCLQLNGRYDNSQVSDGVSLPSCGLKLFQQNPNLLLPISDQTSSHPFLKIFQKYSQICLKNYLSRCKDFGYLTSDILNCRQDDVQMPAMYCTFNVSSKVNKNTANVRKYHRNLCTLIFNIF